MIPRSTAMSFSDLPLKRKLTLLSMLTSGVALAIACFAFVVYEQVTFRRFMVRELSTLAEMIGYNSSSALSFSDSASAEQTLRSLTAQPNILAACIYDAKGNVFATYQRSDYTIPAWPQVRVDPPRFGRDALDLFRPIVIDGERAGTLFLRSSREQMQERLERYLLIAALVMLVAAAAAYAIAMRTQRVISGPVSELAGIARVVALEKNYAVRAVKQTNDELGHLIDGFNEMLAQIQTRDAALQRAHDELEMRVTERTADLQSEITERRRSEEALRESHVRFEIVTRATSDVIWDWNLENESVWFNENYQSQFGFSADEVPSLAAGWVQGIHPEDLASIKESLRAEFEGAGQTWAKEYRYRRRDGSYAIIHDRGWILRNPQGRPVRMIGAMQDITARRHAEQEVAREQARFKFIFDAVPVGISLVTADEARLHLVNPAHERITGVCAADSSVPGVFARATEPEDHVRQTEVMQRFLRHETDHYSVEKRYRHADGRALWVSLTSRRFFDQASGNEQCVTTLVDITERKQAEAERERIQTRLLDVSRQAGMAEVATGVLHNVGNVLNSVNVAATLVIDQVRASKSANVTKLATLVQENGADLGAFLTSDPRGRQIPGYLGMLATELAKERETVITEMDHLRRHIEHIKEIVAMQQSYAKISGVAEKVPIVDLVEDALRMNAGSLVRHGLEVIRDYRAKPVAVVERHKVLQILVNLIRNAKYACDESGRSDKRLTVRIAADEERIHLSVTDNGIGIPPENMTRIFAHGFTTRAEGHGFGLHSGALAARELGGTLVAQSDGAGHGAVFTLTFPSKPVSAA